MHKFPSFNELKDFEKSFASRFGASNVDTTIMARQFRDLRQLDNQSVSEYHLALVDLATRLSIAGKELSDENIAEQFTWGL